MKRPIGAFLLLLTASAAFGLVSAYHVEPVKASWSNWTLGEDGYVSQLVTCCWDELDAASGGYVELFQGDASGTGTYQLGIREWPSGTPVATSPNVAQGYR